MASKELTLEQLQKLVSDGKATTLQMLDYAEMLKAKANADLQANFNNNISKIEKFATELGVNVDQLKDHYSKPELIFSWKDGEQTFERFTGQMGKMPSWVQTMKNKLTHNEAKAFVVNQSSKGFTFLKNVYEPKNK